MNDSLSASVKEIRDAEEKAAAVRAAGDMRAKEIISAAHTAGRAAKAEAAEECDRALADMRQEQANEADRLSCDARKRAETLTAAVAGAADKKMPDAVGHIVGGIIGQWQ